MVIDRQMPSALFHYVRSFGNGANARIEAEPFLRDTIAVAGILRMDK